MSFACPFEFPWGNSRIFLLKSKQKKTVDKQDTSIRPKWWASKKSWMTRAQEKHLETLCIDWFRFQKVVKKAWRLSHTTHAHQPWTYHSWPAWPISCSWVSSNCVFWNLQLGFPDQRDALRRMLRLSIVQDKRSGRVSKWDCKKWYYIKNVSSWCGQEATTCKWRLTVVNWNSLDFDRRWGKGVGHHVRGPFKGILDCVKKKVSLKTNKAPFRSK